MGTASSKPADGSQAGGSQKGGYSVGAAAPVSSAKPTGMTERTSLLGGPAPAAAVQGAFTGYAKGNLGPAPGTAPGAGGYTPGK